ncbi:MAG TPA: SCO family protein [Gemmatimonadaceae bacterium]|nr:SCO family protein [Gemmatimonadaceae bacterium]
MVRTHRTLAGLVLGGALVFAACSPRGGDRAGTDSNDASGFRGVITSPPREKPDFTLTDFNGKPFNFRRDTEGKVALLFFGYTHCPDVCPLHAANVAAVLKKLPFEAREAIRFVFVSTDPDRDTPERLKEWLGNFDPTFIGVRGSVDEVNRILYAMRMPPIDLSQKPAGAASQYLVGHAAQVVAFGLDGLSRLEYPFGIRQEDWAHDLPKLARGEVPTGEAPSGPGAVELKPMAEADAPAASVRVAAALMPQPATTTEGALYVVLRNGAAEDTLYEVVSDAAARAEVHETMPGDHGKMGHMMPVKEVVVRAGETLQFVPGARHVMLFDFKERPAIGDAVPVRLRFRRAGDVVVAANVVAYADVERMLAAAVSTLGQ